MGSPFELVIQIITIGHKMPDWIKSGFDHYHKKIQMKCKLIEIHPQNQKNIIKYLNQGVSHIALDDQGKQLTSEKIAEQINIWKMDGINVNFYIGAHDGFPPEVLERCQKKMVFIKSNISPSFDQNHANRAAVSIRMYFKQSSIS